MEPVSNKITEVLDDQAGKQAIAALVETWDNLAPLEKAWAEYYSEFKGDTTVEKHNTAQQKLRATFDPFFIALHDSLKQIDKAVRRHEKALTDVAKQAGKRQIVDRAIKQLKSALEELPESNHGQSERERQRESDSESPELAGSPGGADLLVAASRG